MWLFFLCCTSDPTELPASHLERHSIHRLRYNSMHAWIAKPEDIHNIVLVLPSTITEATTACFELQSSKDRSALWFMTESSNEDNARQYLARISSLPIEKMEFKCP